MTFGLQERERQIPFPNFGNRNASGKFYGPTRLREGLLQSRNLVSVRVLRELGVEKEVINHLEDIGFMNIKTKISNSFSDIIHENWIYVLAEKP